jgi:ABC-type Mn2+/Zn2+ transport system permease subunit
MIEFLTESHQFHTFVTATALGLACSVLSIVVVLRRWAFIGEGIAHGGFGGIGTAWLLSLLFPILRGDAPAYGVAVLFCFLMALAIGFFSRGQRVGGDAIIGIFLVASLAWGFVALSIFQHHDAITNANWERYLLGDIRLVTAWRTMFSVIFSIMILLITALLRKEIIAYCFDPLLAKVSGVRTDFIHYLLMILLALVVIVGMGIAGNLLIPAMLVLPGATALTLSTRLRNVVFLSAIVSLIGALGGLLLNLKWHYLPTGASMALVLFGQFLLAYLTSAVRGNARA